MGVPWAFSSLLLSSPRLAPWPTSCSLLFGRVRSCFCIHTLSPLRTVIQLSKCSFVVCSTPLCNYRSSSATATSLTARQVYLLFSVEAVNQPGHLALPGYPSNSWFGGRRDLKTEKGSAGGLGHEREADERWRLLLAPRFPSKMDSEGDV